MDEYKYNNSIYNQFADNCLEIGGVDDAMSPNELIKLFNEWATDNNVINRPNNTKLIKELKTIGILRGDSVSKRVGGVTVRVYQGVKRSNVQNF